MNVCVSKVFSFAFAVLFVVLGVGGVSAEMVFADGDRSFVLPDSEADVWVGATLQGNEIGYMHSAYSALESGGFRARTTSAVGGIVEYEETVSADLRLLSFKISESSTGFGEEGHVRGNQLFLTVMDADGRREEVIDLSGPVYSGMSHSYYAALHGLRAGAAYSFMVYSPEEEDVVVMQQRVSGPVESPVDGKPVWRIESSYAGNKVTYWMDKGLRLVKGGYNDGAFEISRMGREDAMQVLVRACKANPYPACSTIGQ